MIEIYYKNFLINLKKRGFEFWSFKNYINNLDKIEFPDKLILLRHDIHIRDIENAYKMINIETDIFGHSPATYFVQYNYKPTNSTNPLEYKREQAEKAQNNYINFINYCIINNIDVQPHISASSMFIDKFNPDWDKLSKEEFSIKFKENYMLKNIKSSFSHMELVVINQDFMNIDFYIKETIKLIKIYNNEWDKKFGFYPEGCSTHGSTRPIISVLHDNRLLDLSDFVNSNCYTYQCNARSFYADNKINYLTDNYKGEWMKNSELIDDGRWQILVHPKQWDLIEI